MATSPVFGWPLPDPSDLVRDLPADFDAFSDALEATLADTILQVVTVQKTDTFTLSANTTYTLITGMELSITPASTSSRILLLPSIYWDFTSGGSGGYNICGMSLFRGGTNLAAPGSPGNRFPAMAWSFPGGGDGGVWSPSFIDSPNTTSSTTYDVRVRTGKATLHVLNINRDGDDTDDTEHARGVSRLTAVELAS